MSQHGCPERLSGRAKGGYQEEGGSAPTMEVLVETLTGTAFEMTVSPSDTIFAIKSKIFRVEGIPVAQQHILYNLKEVEDSASLDSLNITDGARLRLVLGLRGGPISTRRLPPPPPLDASWRDIERLLDNTREDNGRGCKVTVLVVRDGERVSMLRVRENEDGSYSPIDVNKYSSSTLKRMPEVNPCDSPPTPAIPPGFGPIPARPPQLGSLGHLGTGLGGSTLGLGESFGANSGLGGSTMGLGESFGASGLGGSSLGLGVAAAAAEENAVTLGKMLELKTRMHALAPASRRHSNKDTIQKTRSEEILSRSGLLDDRVPEYKHTYQPYADEEHFTQLYDGDYIRYDYDCAFTDRYTLLPPIGARAESEQSVQDAADARLALDPATLHDAPAHPYGGVGVWGGVDSLSGGGGALAAAHSASATSLGGGVGGGGGVGARGGGAGGRALLSASSSQLETLHTRALHRHPNTEHLHLSDEGLNVTHKPKNLEVGSERRQRRIKKIAELENNTQPEDPKPDLKEEAKPKKIPKIRCLFCRKKLSIATVHKCRCGSEFCAPHRYAEVHGCAYDYKANAHQYLERANPLVSAPKLPKI